MPMSVGGVLLFGAPEAHAAATLLGPTPYLSQNDSPFLAAITGGTVVVETFEDGALNATVGGTSASADFGSVLGPSGVTDSVDADDGTIDGSGTGRHSSFNPSGAQGVTFTFSGPLPNAAGIVWTDGNNNIHFEAFDASNNSLGTLTGSHADGGFSGSTAEDRFYGVINAAGIKSIHISNDGGGIEVDHLQFGTVPITQPGTVPEPSTVLLVGSGFLAFAALRRRLSR